VKQIKMNKQHNQSKGEKNAGAIKVRSNVCGTANSWHLVPGDKLPDDYPYHSLTEKQRKEQAYYLRCSFCHRTGFEINENGCDRPECNRNGTISTAEAAENRKRA